MLLEGIKECNACSLRRETTQPILPEGDPTGGLVVVGRNPGGSEQKLLRPFVGPGGKCLDRLLESINVDRSKIWITNLCKCASIADRPPLNKEIQSCLALLGLELFIIKPTLVLLLGNQVIRTFFPDAPSATRSHGTVMEYTLKTEAGNVPFVTVWLHHPGYILRQGTEHLVMAEDMPVVRKAIEVCGLTRVLR